MSNHDTMSPSHVEAHMPPTTYEHDELDEIPELAPFWNPETNTWETVPVDPGAVTLAHADRNQMPSHGDLAVAQPMSEDPGDPRTYPPEGSGSAPDARANLLSSIRSPMQAAVPPEQVHRHIVETNEVPNSAVRARLIVVAGNTQPTTVLEENPNRDRALISVFTAGSTILLAPLRGGGNPQLIAAPTLPGNFWPHATADGPIEIKSSDGVEAYGVTAAGIVLVRVWEELKGNKNEMPGLS